MVLAALLASLACFAAWGAWRGSLRQLGSLAVLYAAFPVARAFGPKMEGAVAKVLTATPEARVRVAWAAAWLLCLLLGGGLLSALQPMLRRWSPPGRGERRWGAALGVMHGLVLLAVLSTGVLLAATPPERPDWVTELEQGPAGRGLLWFHDGLAPVLPLPPWLAEDLLALAARIRA